MFYAVWLEGQLVWNTPLLAGLICVGTLYAFLLLSFTNIKIHHKQPLLFFLCLGIIYVTIGSPLSAISHLSFSLHMIQMSIIFFIIPPLILLGIPDSFPKIVKGLNKLFLPPKAALFTFAALFLMYHLPVVFAFLSQNSFVHNGFLFVLLVMSFSMWRPIGKEQNKRYAFLSGLLLLPACIFFILTAFIGGLNNPLHTQMTATLCISPVDLRSLTILPYPFNTKFDQIMAGILMVGMHELALFVTFRVGKKVQVRDLGRNG
ncbi:cytochrome c oxidase assembly protein [Neobacillus sp. WH10]|uniref:cytochrome c oxidase assembly protein n=1 Tax=Neobacillus sp. WH10 TaxID=3047873 RepID=UPI0024C14E14|nr:cytochrome c oxidase assembly protein [Neobacillus sp. WH10]WHY76863.1 cytochrome c oxidase assembly protein [Neobacillus sp. WH10]